MYASGCGCTKDHACYLRFSLESVCDKRRTQRLSALNALMHDALSGIEFSAVSGLTPLLGAVMVWCCEVERTMMKTEY